ncbi:MAG: DUF4386 domain-containing protein [Mycobacteriales bacterium]
MPAVSPTTDRTASPGGPPPLVPALAFGVLTIAAVVAGVGIPRPGASAAHALAYDSGHVGLLRLLATLLFASSIPLAIWAAVTYRRLRGLGVGGPGPLMGFAGGILAAVSVAASGLFTWTAAESAGIGNAAIARVLTSAAFAFGAAGFVVPLGLLVAGFAVPALILHLLPRPIAWAGLVISVLAMASTLTLLTASLDPLLPIGRFGGLLWIVVAAAMLPRDRTQTAVTPQ